MLRILFFLLFTTLSFSQTRTIIGVVSDDSNIPLESANVIAKPLQDKAYLKFAVGDIKGCRAVFCTLRTINLVKHMLKL